MYFFLFKKNNNLLNQIKKKTNQKQKTKIKNSNNKKI